MNYVLFVGWRNRVDFFLRILRRKCPEDYIAICYFVYCALPIHRFRIGGWICSMILSKFGPYEQVRHHACIRCCFSGSMETYPSASFNIFTYSILFTRLWRYIDLITPRYKIPSQNFLRCSISLTALELLYAQKWKLLLLKTIVNKYSKLGLDWILSKIVMQNILL